MPGRLLLVDDDRFIINHLQKFLGAQGFHCTCAIDADTAWRALQKEPFDLLILDIGLPDVDGLTFCRRIRAHHSLPIIMLTARDGTHDKVLGLELGADDYITKPFEPAEILARIRAQLRRTQEYQDDQPKLRPLTIRGLILDAEAHEVQMDGRPVMLTKKEFDLLHVLAKNAGRAVARDWLFEKVWGWDADYGVKTLAVYVRRLRCKIEPDPNHPTYIQTVRGFGYKLVSEA